MRAIVFNGEHETVQTVPDPSPGADEVLLQVEYCGICGSDLHAATGDFRPGTVMGHEFTGRVVDVGRDVRDWAAGDRVVVNPNGDWCGHCDACGRGEVNMCPEIWAGAVGLSRNGGLAPLVAVRARVLRRLPDELDFRRGAWVEPLAVALRTVRRSEFRIGESALVLGGGPIGLLVTTLLRAAGAREITVVEPSAGRCAMALRMGATATIDPGQIDPADHFTASARPAFAFDCAGIASTPQTAVRALKPHGRLTITGFSRVPPAVDSADVLFKELDIRGSFIYVDEFELAIDLLARRTVGVEPLISGVVDIEHAASAFAAMRTSPDAFKYLISGQQDSSGQQDPSMQHSTPTKE